MTALSLFAYTILFLEQPNRFTTTRNKAIFKAISKSHIFSNSLNMYFILGDAKWVNHHIKVTHGTHLFYMSATPCLLGKIKLKRMSANRPRKDKKQAEVPRSISTNVAKKFKMMDLISF